MIENIDLKLLFVSLTDIDVDKDYDDDDYDDDDDDVLMSTDDDDRDQISIVAELSLRFQLIGRAGLSYSTLLSKIHCKLYTA